MVGAFWVFEAFLAYDYRLTLVSSWRVAKKEAKKKKKKLKRPIVMTISLRFIFKGSQEVCSQATHCSKIFR